MNALVRPVSILAIAVLPLLPSAVHAQDFVNTTDANARVERRAAEQLRRTPLYPSRVRSSARAMSPKDKPLVWLYGHIKTPPMSREARIEAGYLLRRVQRGDKLSMPHSRPMPSIGPRCHELRVGAAGVTWRIVYRIDADAVVLADVFGKKTRATPQASSEPARNA